MKPIDYNRVREPGKIVDVFYGSEDHGILTVNIGIDYDAGCHQCFGGLALGNENLDKSLAEDYINDLCRTFGVNSLDDLKGKKCFALKNFDNYNEIITGLEAENGRRFVHYTWRKKHFPKIKSPLEDRMESLYLAIENAKRRLQDAEKELSNLKGSYREWK